MDKSLLSLARLALTQAISTALPTIHKQAGESTLNMLNFMFPQGHFEQIDIGIRMRKPLFSKSVLIELKVTRVKGEVMREGFRSRQGHGNKTITGISGSDTGLLGAQKND